MQMNREEGFEAGENYRRLRFRRWEIILAAGPSPGFDERNFPERSFNRHPSSFLLIQLVKRKHRKPVTRLKKYSSKIRENDCPKLSKPKNKIQSNPSRAKFKF